MGPLSPQRREAGREAGGQQSRGRGQVHPEARRGLLREPKGRVGPFTGGQPYEPTGHSQGRSCAALKLPGPCAEASGKSCSGTLCEIRKPALI